MKKLLSFLGINRSRKINVTNMAGHEPQDYRLKAAMKSANLNHGDRVIADVGPVQIQHTKGEKEAKLFFCAVREGGVTVHKKLEEGDGRSLPMRATVKGLSVSKSIKGATYFILKNVSLYSNGTLQVSATENTVLEQLSAAQATEYQRRKEKEYEKSEDDSTLTTCKRMSQEEVMSFMDRFLSQ